MTRCLGWAYEPCPSEAAWFIVMSYAGGVWEGSPLCLVHLVKALEPTESWTRRPLHRLVTPYPAEAHIVWPGSDGD